MGGPGGQGRSGSLVNPETADPALARLTVANAGGDSCGAWGLLHLVTEAAFMVNGWSFRGGTGPGGGPRLSVLPPGQHDWAPQLRRDEKLPPPCRVPVCARQLWARPLGDIRSRLFIPGLSGTGTCGLGPHWPLAEVMACMRATLASWAGALRLLHLRAKPSRFPVSVAIGTGVVRPPGSPRGVVSGLGSQAAGSSVIHTPLLSWVPLMLLLPHW